MNVVELKIDQIDIPELTLRPLDKEDPAFQELVADVETYGVQQSISVNHYVDENGNDRYTLVDGLQRLSAAREAGIDSLVCILEDDMGTTDMLAKQFRLNKHRVDTRPAAFGKQMRRILDENPDWTIDKLAQLLSVTNKFIQDRLKLDDLDSNVQKMVDRGEVNLTNALNLQTLPKEERDNWVDRAANQDVTEFGNAVAARRKEIKAALNKGKQVEDEGFVANPIFRKKSDVVDEMTNHGMRKQFMKAHPNAKPEEAFDYAISWVMHMDPETIAERKAKWEKDQQERAAKKKAAKEAKKSA